MKNRFVANPDHYRINVNAALGIQLHCWSGDTVILPLKLTPVAHSVPSFKQYCRMLRTMKIHLLKTKFPSSHKFLDEFVKVL